ncbi:MAG: Fe-S protein assembly co-chaperone HscB [Bacteroidota bacterium]
MNYFEFYDLPISFTPDEAQLKRTFYANSKKYHPDFFIQESPEKQAEILELSTLNNQAYQTLRHPDKRMQYILQLKGVLAEEGQNTLPQAFLMDMMDFNESLMELEFDPNPEVLQQLQRDLTQMEDALYAAIRPQLEHYRDEAAEAAPLQAIKDYYLKRRYLLRIRENLDKFASR